ncbi:DUF4249 domain-containing protein [Pedobacter sandarakinus]|uniref:DUF4249 domain-containing protein n=1 Tax=Pedobacter sandarakinus TaxID=353156 RepID=UPI002247E646|nr:DUF4249 domain-containing protein [Pedobacter sandarakinus]MCX2573216.1 DUF4249 domain-containing protein [Pedobacter sandarakinus]
MEKKLFIYVIAIICLFSCKKIIQIDTDNAEPQVVIEGKIIDRLVEQQIIISKTVRYDEANSYPKLSGAKVTVSDSRGNNFVFAEKEPGVYVNRMRGVSGVTYNLDITVDGKNYKASSTMPKLVKLDSIGVIKNSFFGNERRTAAAFLVDPADEINFYHFNLYVNSRFSKRIYVNNDRLTNGNKLRIQLFYDADEDDDGGLKSGDSVGVEMECIDANMFDYWYALSEQSGRGPNQGTTPANPTSNISNNALGYFSAHSYQRLNATVK